MRRRDEWIGVVVRRDGASSSSGQRTRRQEKDGGARASRRERECAATMVGTSRGRTSSRSRGCERRDEASVQEVGGSKGRQAATARLDPRGQLNPVASLPRRPRRPKQHSSALRTSKDVPRRHRGRLESRGRWTDGDKGMPPPTNRPNPVSPSPAADAPQTLAPSSSRPRSPLTPTSTPGGLFEPAKLAPRRLQSRAGSLAAREPPPFRFQTLSPRLPLRCADLSAHSSLRRSPVTTVHWERVASSRVWRARPPRASVSPLAVLVSACRFSSSTTSHRLALDAIRPCSPVRSLSPAPCPPLCLSGEAAVWQTRVRSQTRLRGSCPPL
ncbi:hypothetical protein DMC30DRAFT_67744 [Rhodotorula diobovata]|uniref:Uncharacterized protein n=1 Tax=Rhodotorula diobovata TaxID=5288 RepID=A0A5C5G472_9BASI|nr:hypothetical protein DMC30DRAFT_67744 [Rhodotorula diobovata]